MTDKPAIDLAVGHALNRLRQERGLTVTALATLITVSALAGVPLTGPAGRHLGGVGSVAAPGQLDLPVGERFAVGPEDHLGGLGGCRLHRRGGLAVLLGALVDGLRSVDRLGCGRDRRPEDLWRDRAAG